MGRVNPSAEGFLETVDLKHVERQAVLGGKALVALITLKRTRKAYN